MKLMENLNIRTLLSFLNLIIMVSFIHESVNAQNQPLDWIPYLTENKDFIYVDRDLKKQVDASFFKASPFLSTGYAIVEDKERKNAVIDSKGNLVVDYTDESIVLNVVGNLTLIKKVLDYDKKMPIWRWDWNILGSSIIKNKTYHKVDIRVLETNQIILSEDIPYDENSYSLNCELLDENHFILNDILYEVKNKRLKKIKSDIVYALDKGRYIPNSETKFSIYSTNSKKPLLSDLVGTNELHLIVNNQSLLLDSINLDRFSPIVPKLLKERKNGRVYVFPQYDKAFPSHINHANENQLGFLKEVSLVYSIHNSPYFILGRFNYDHDIWAYDWMYLDEQGNLLSEIMVKDFYMMDRVGYVVWPDKYMILSKKELEKDWKIGKIEYVYQSENLYIVEVKQEGKKTRKGIWNADTKEWGLDPSFTSIQFVDSKNQVFALQEEVDGEYYLYNYELKERIGVNSYNLIYSDGMVQVKTEGNEEVYFYIDMVTGKEYRD